MARSLPLVSTIFVFFLLLVATEMGPIMVAEARTCETPSNNFKGLCVSDTNCASVCQTEGFPGGHCEGFRQRCFCTKPC
ncbi:putative defensin, plant [Medicago truncatula]|uniref:Defensin MtDef4.4 n=1 Tax=Medicago truncatula TaxID=3880 RepID=G7ZX16_MEDTR|nr:defensin Ec-AMP-D1 [Medicago truncatula]AET03455.1 Defensin MtDef4.4 [Medicago truncatula]RHN41710.1 putative defensin, plant [Medicago truncatula]